MNAVRLSFTNCLALLLLLLPACSSPRPRAFADAAALPAQSAMPDPLVLLNGERVTSRAQWFQQRRPELQDLFQHYMYGALPPEPVPVQAKVLGQYADFLNGQATLKVVSLEVGPFPQASTLNPGPSAAANPLRIDLMLVVPNQRSAPAPVFLAMDFWGNHAITADPRVPLAHSWLSSSRPGSVNNAATEASRGTQATYWPLAEIVRRGYALAAFYHGDIDADRQDACPGIYALLAGTNAAPANRGTLAAWAWGFHRCVDYLVRDPDLDPKRIAAVGHSRNGKACLLAAAFDERIAIAFPHQAGMGGSAPSRGKTGESVKAINRSFPHWFNAEFKQFNDVPERLPVDQNSLVALCAPRPVLFTAAQEDQWANPAGQFEVLRAADPVYRFLGSEGLEAKEPPPLRQLVDSPLGYYLREGRHSMTPDDWRVFMDFADKQFGRK